MLEPPPNQTINYVIHHKASIIYFFLKFPLFLSCSPDTAALQQASCVGNAKTIDPLTTGNSPRFPSVSVTVPVHTTGVS